MIQIARLFEIGVALCNRLEHRDGETQFSKPLLPRFTQCKLNEFKGRISFVFCFFYRICFLIPWKNMSGFTKGISAISHK